MCDQTYTVATETALAMHKTDLILAMCAAIFAVGCLWEARLALRRSPSEGQGLPQRRRWGKFAGLLLATSAIALIIWGATAGFFIALRFTVNSSEIVAVEVDTMRFVAHKPNKVIRTTRLDDPADLCRLIELLRTAPVGDWQGAVGKGDEFYRVRFVRVDETYDMNWLEVTQNGYHEKNINIVLLSEEGKRVGMALHSPAINDWLQSKLAAHESSNEGQ